MAGGGHPLRLPRIYVYIYIYILESSRVLRAGLILSLHPAHAKLVVEALVRSSAPFWKHSGTMLAPCWEDFRSTLKSSGGHGASFAHHGLKTGQDGLQDEDKMAPLRKPIRMILR